MARLLILRIANQDEPASRRAFENCGLALVASAPARKFLTDIVKIVLILRKYEQFLDSVN